MDAVVVIDKPLAVTSFDVVAQVRRLMGERRIGHAGTLDPLATGVLVLCLGETTKLVPYLMDADKEYRATARLGVATDTDDADPRAQIVSRAPEAALRQLDAATIQDVLARMTGDVRQRPPRFSALKVDGQRLYDKARLARRQGPDPADAAEGEPGPDAVDMATADKTRTVRIDEIVVESLQLQPPTDGTAAAGWLPEVTFRVRCGKGTYIRSIARDLGDALGVGAHLGALRRLRVGRFDVAGAVPPSDVARAPRHDLVSALAHLPQLHVQAAVAGRIRCGQPAVLTDLRPLLPAMPQPVAVIDPAGQLVAILDAAGPPAQPGIVPAHPRWQIARGFVPRPIDPPRRAAAAQGQE